MCSTWFAGWVEEKSLRREYFCRYEWIGMRFGLKGGLPADVAAVAEGFGAGAG